MKRALTLAAVAAVATLTTAPASAVPPRLTCVSFDLECQRFSCADDQKTVFHNGFYDSGPWVVVCV